MSEPFEFGNHSNDLEDALKSFDVFKFKVGLVAKKLAHQCGLIADLDNTSLELIHTDWMTEIDAWLQSDMIEEKTTELNHFKSFAVLLDELSARPYVIFRKRTRSECTADEWFKEYQDAYNANQDLAKSLLDGGHVYLAWLMMHDCIAHYEAHREGRVSDFKIRITEAFEHEVVVVIARGHHNRYTLYNTLCALFLRD